MNKLVFFVCENFYPEFKDAILVQGFSDVIITAYPSMCQDKSKKAEAERLLIDCQSNGDDGVILCGNHCDILALIPKPSSFTTRITSFCFLHMANEKFIEYILNRGGYVISLGWVNNWRANIEKLGFDQITARGFYKDFARELVFFDAGISSQAENNLKELSEFLDLPYVMIPFEKESTELLVRSMVFEWRLHKKSQEYLKENAGLQTQCAEYSMIFDLIGKIALYTNKRDTIEKIQEIFLMILGAQKFKYWDVETEIPLLPSEIQALFTSSETPYVLEKSKNRFYIKITQKHKIFGVIDVSEFLFPEHIEKYLNFAIEIVRVCGLVLSNIEQYEKLIKSEQEMEYLSCHDALTGLFNRNYVNKTFESEKNYEEIAVFMFDIDGLKYANDRFGHSEGDRLIISAANILKSCFRETDTVSRIGGDEFIAIVEGCSLDMADRFMSRLKSSMVKHNNGIKADHLKVSISGGFALSGGGGETIETLSHRADALMYVEKARKKAENLTIGDTN